MNVCSLGVFGGRWKRISLGVVYVECLKLYFVFGDVIKGINDEGMPYEAMGENP